MSVSIEQQYIFDIINDSIVWELNLCEPIDRSTPLVELQAGDAWYAIIDHINYEFDIDLDPEVCRNGTIGSLCAMVADCV